MSVLITGGLGYIGGNVAKALLEKGEEVILLDNLSNTSIGKASLIKSITKKNFKVYPKDLLNEGDIIQVFKENQIEAVIYLAESQSSDSIKYYKENINMLFNTLNTMKTFNCKRLVFASSDIYNKEGEQKEDFENINILSDIDVKLKTKVMLESILSDFYKSNQNENWAFGILRLFNISGCDSSGMLGDVNLKGNDIFTKLMKYEINSEPVVISNKYLTFDNSLVRDYTHITDVVKGIIKMLGLLRVSPNSINTFNISTGKPTSEKQAIKLYQIVTNSKVKVTEEYKTDERISYRVGNKEKAMKILKYDNDFTLDVILKTNKEFCSNYNQILKDYKAAEKEIQNRRKKEVDKNEE